MKRDLIHRLRHFGSDERGAVLTETIIFLPALLWAYLALFMYWDAYSTQNVSQKATYAIADMLSRKLDDVDDKYIDGMKKTFDYLMANEAPVRLVVSSVIYDEKNNRYVVDWSKARNSRLAAGDVQAVPLTTATLLNYIDKLPVMPDGDSVIVVQTSYDYKPAFMNFGLTTYTNSEFIVTRPRSQPKIAYSS